MIYDIREKREKKKKAIFTQSNLDSISQLLTSSQHLVSAFNRETEILSSEEEDAWVNKLSESSSVNGSLGDL